MHVGGEILLNLTPATSKFMSWVCKIDETMLCFSQDVQYFQPQPIQNQTNNAPVLES